MSLKHIFISHARQDAKIAEKLAKHLRNAGHEIKVDMYNISLGDDIINFINESIANAYIIIILLSKYSVKAKWQKFEIYTALWNELEQSGGQCIPVMLLQPIIVLKKSGNTEI